MTPTCWRCEGTPCECSVDYFAGHRGAVSMRPPAILRPLGEDPAPIEHVGAAPFARCPGCQLCIATGWGEPVSSALKRHADELAEHLKVLRAAINEARSREVSTLSRTSEAV